MRAVRLEDIMESNRIKREICESCIEDLKGILNDEQLKMFEETFYDIAAKVILSERRK